MIYIYNIHSVKSMCPTLKNLLQFSFLLNDVSGHETMRRRSSLLMGTGFGWQRELEGGLSLEKGLVLLRLMEGAVCANSKRKGI